MKLFSSLVDVSLRWIICLTKHIIQVWRNTICKLEYLLVWGVTLCSVVDIFCNCRWTYWLHHQGTSCRFLQTPVNLYQTTCHHIWEESTLNSHYHGSVTSCMKFLSSEPQNCTLMFCSQICWHDKAIVKNKISVTFLVWDVRISWQWVA